MRAATATIVLGVVLALLVACTTTSVSPSPDNYPLPNDPPTLHVFLPAALGSAVRVVVSVIRIRAGDRIEILSGQPIGKITGADVELFISRQRSPGQTLPAEPALNSFEGAVMTNSADGGETQVAVVAQITPQSEGRFELTDLRVTYRINDGIAEQGTGIVATVTVCGGAATCNAQ